MNTTEISTYEQNSHDFNVLFQSASRIERKMIDFMIKHGLGEDEKMFMVRDRLSEVLKEELNSLFTHH